MKTIERKIKPVQDRARRLEQPSPGIISFGEYLSSPDLKDIGERNIQVAIEGCLDIARLFNLSIYGCLDSFPTNPVFGTRLLV